VAAEIRSDYEKSIKEEILPRFTEELQAIEQKQEEIRNVEGSKEKAVSDMKALLKATKTQITMIMKA
jgi:MoaA/NifB/PqqE/SkfB family radical SAM enzyme